MVTTFHYVYTVVLFAQVAADLRLKEFECLLLHGDMEQADRNKVIVSFKKNECSLLVGSDIFFINVEVGERVSHCLVRNYIL